MRTYCIATIPGNGIGKGMATTADVTRAVCEKIGNPKNKQLAA